MRAEHGPLHGEREDADRSEATFARHGVGLLRPPCRSLLVEQVEIELLRLEREEVASACADGARLALALREPESPRPESSRPESPKPEGQLGARLALGDEQDPVGRDVDDRAIDHPWHGDRHPEVAKRARACLAQRIESWRERVRCLLTALQLEGLAVPSVLAQAFGSPTSAWPSAASLAQAACIWSPSDEHRVLCARASLLTGSIGEARVWLRSVPPRIRPSDLARELDVDGPPGLECEESSKSSTVAHTSIDQRAGGIP